MRKQQAVEVGEETQMGRKHHHPAFGVVQLVRSYGGGRTMFGSELKHNGAMVITVSQAYEERGLNNSRHVEGQMICQFEFSLAQWAQFIASQGIGAGVPCTFNYYREGETFTAVPTIAPRESTKDVFRREMAEQVAERLSTSLVHLRKLRAMVEEGKGKVAMREEISEAIRHVEQLPGSVRFIDEQFAKQVERIVSDAMTEVETFVTGMATNLGIEALKNGAPLLPGQKEE